MSTKNATHSPKQTMPERENSHLSRPPAFKLRLFIAGTEPNSVIAQKNIDNLRAAYAQENFELEIIDVYQDFSRAIEENILVTPALVVDKPKKIKIFGNLDEKNKVLSALGLL